MILTGFDHVKLIWNVHFILKTVHNIKLMVHKIFKNWQDLANAEDIILIVLYQYSCSKQINNHTYSKKVVKFKHCQIISLLNIQNSKKILQWLGFFAVF